MATVQTTYTEDQPVAVAGMPANTQPRGVDSYRVNQTGGIPFGRAVHRDSSSDDVVNLGAEVAGTSPFGLTGFLGVVIADLSIPARTGEADEVGNGDMCAVLHSGDVWVTVDAAVTAGQAAAVTTATGKFNATAQATAQVGLIPNAVFRSDQAAADGLALLRLNAGSVRG